MRNYDWTPDRQLTEPSYNIIQCAYCDSSVWEEGDICDYCELEIAIKRVEDSNYYVIKKASKDTIVKKTKELMSDLAIGFAAWATAVTISILAWTILL